jgi:hypothetical protein
MLTALGMFCKLFEELVSWITNCLLNLEKLDLNEEDQKLWDEIQPRLEKANAAFGPVLEGVRKAYEIVRDGPTDEKDGADGRLVRQALAACREALDEHLDHLCDHDIFEKIMRAERKPRYQLTAFKAELVNQLGRLSICYTRTEAALALCWQEFARIFRLTGGWADGPSATDVAEFKQDVKTAAFGVSDPDATIPKEVRHSGSQVSDAVDGLGQHVESVGESIASFIGDETAGAPYGGSIVAPGGTVDLERQVDLGLGAILGAPLAVPTMEKPDTRFAGRITRLLDRGIERREEDGQITFVRRNPSLSVATLEDGQRLGGTQAALTSYLSSEVETIKKLIGQLRPTLLDVDEDTIEYLKDDLGRRLDALTSEVGREGGPIPERVDTLIDAAKDDLDDLATRLVGERAGQLSPVHFRDLPLAERERIEELIRVIEETLENARKAIKDRIAGSDAELPKSRGARLALLARTVEALPASVQQAYRALDSAGLGQSDRRAFREIGNLLEWIKTSAENDWAVRLRDGDARRIEIGILRDEAQRLDRELGDLLSAKGGSAVGALWEGHRPVARGDRGLESFVPYGRRRVERAFRELQTLLGRSVRLAESLVGSEYGKPALGARA